MINKQCAKRGTDMVRSRPVLSKTLTATSFPNIDIPVKGIRASLEPHELMAMLQEAGKSANESLLTAFVFPAKTDIVENDFIIHAGYYYRCNHVRLEPPDEGVYIYLLVIGTREKPV